MSLSGDGAERRDVLQPVRDTGASLPAEEASGAEARLHDDGGKELPQGRLTRVFVDW